MRYMRFGKGADCAAVAMLVNEALSVKKSKKKHDKLEGFKLNECFSQGILHKPSLSLKYTTPWK